MPLTAPPAPTASDLQRLERYDSSVRFRGLIEMALARRLVKDLIDHGYNVSVDNGDEMVVKGSADIEQIIDACFEVEDAFLHVKGPRKPAGWVRLVMGNSGWDLICDYTTNLEPVLEPVNVYAEELALWCQ